MFYINEASFGLPHLESIAYRVFYDYYDLYIESVIGKSTNASGVIELDLIQGKSKTPKNEDSHDIMAIKLELEEHVRTTYENFESPHLLKVKEVLDELNLSNHGRFPIVEVW